MPQGQEPKPLQPAVRQGNPSHDPQRERILGRVFAAAWVVNFLQ